MKLLNTYDIKIVDCYQNAKGYLPMKLSIAYRCSKAVFLPKLEKLHSVTIYNYFVNEHKLLNINKFWSKYKFSGSIKHCEWEQIMWQHFESIVLNVQLLLQKLTV